MTRRQAKKRVQKKWRIQRGTWPAALSPRKVDAVLTMCTNYIKAKIAEALEHAILYGAGDGGLHVQPRGIRGGSL